MEIFKLQNLASEFMCEIVIGQRILEQSHCEFHSKDSSNCIVDPRHRNPLLFDQRLNIFQVHCQIEWKHHLHKNIKFRII